MNKNVSKNSNSLSILNANVRSLSRNYSNFTHFLNNIDIKFSLLSLTESWLKHDNVALFSIRGYSHEYNLRQRKQGGGVSLFIANHINYVIRKD